MLAGISGPHRAFITGVHDGDTFYCRVLVGEMTLSNERYELWACPPATPRRPEGVKFRLAGCAAAELSTDAGKAARANLAAMLPVGLPVTLVNVDDYKYGGEYIATVILPGDIDLANTLTAQQWAAPWDGNGKQPLPPWPRTV